MADADNIASGEGIGDEITKRIKGLKNVLTKGVREDYPPLAREIIAKHGDNDVAVSARVCRKPLGKMIQYAVKKFANPAKSMHDQFFHLSIRFHMKSGKVIIVEKNENLRVRYETGKDRDKLTQCKPAVLPSGKQLTLNEILKNTEKMYKTKREYFDYDSVRNNCQRYVAAVADSNGIIYDRDFVLQDISGLLPEWVGKVSNFLTGFKARVNQVVQGYGVGAQTAELVSGEALSNQDIDDYYMSKLAGHQLSGSYKPCRSHRGFMDGAYPPIADTEFNVFNMDNKPNGAGTHWVCYANRGKKCFYYDSFGLVPPDAFVKHCRKSGKQLKYSDTQIQNVSTANCGYWCVDFLNKMMAGQKPNAILDAQEQASTANVKIGKGLSEKIARMLKPNAANPDFNLWDLLFELGANMMTKNMTPSEARKYAHGGALEQNLRDLYEGVKIKKNDWLKGDTPFEPQTLTTEVGKIKKKLR